MPPPDTRLCSLCDALDIVAAIDGLRAYETRTLPHQLSHASLVASAVSCRLCTVFHASLFREGRFEEQSALRRPASPSPWDHSRWTSNNTVQPDHVRKTSTPGSVLPDFMRRTSTPQSVVLPDHIRRSSTPKSTQPEYIRRTSTPKSFLARVASSDSDIPRTDSGTSIVEDVVGWHEELDRRSDGPGFVIEIKAQSTLDADFALEYVLHYQRPVATGTVVEGPKPRSLVLSNEMDLGLGILNRPIASSPSFTIYSTWMKECAAGVKHIRCRKAEPVRLPTRLIDVGTGAGSNIPKLVSTAGMRGQYLTLSHCWGKHRIIVTTSKNIRSHQEGIAFTQFPKMFRDAMLITRIMGVRYIWIDTLCIVQDDVADWEQECSRMGEVYRNSVCTLAAPSAPDSETGLLAHRSPSDLPFCDLLAHRDGKPLGRVTIGPPPSELKEHTGVLSSRAWVLQEQVLSPRTLCFGRNGMYFQCNSHEQLESYHHALPPERVTSWRTSQASDLPKPLINMAASDAVYWYFIVRQYSFRHLTYGDDKLPAISGLADRIANTLEEDDDVCELGEYWAGLWSKDLGRGLMWTCDTSWDPSKTLHTIDKCMPSWSWASQNTPVEWKVLREFRPDFECVGGIVERTGEHQFGRISSGRLEVNAPVKSATLQRQSIPGRRIMVCGIADIREVAELCFDNTSEQFFRAAWPEVDTSFSCRLLMLGHAVSSLYGKRWYALVLVPLGRGKYRRLGVANSLGHGATHARTLGLEQSWDWFGNARTESVVIV